LTEQRILVMPLAKHRLFVSSPRPPQAPGPGAFVWSTAFRRVVPHDGAERFEAPGPSLRGLRLEYRLQAGSSSPRSRKFVAPVGSSSGPGGAESGNSASRNQIPDSIALVGRCARPGKLTVSRRPCILYPAFSSVKACPRSSVD